MRVLHIIVDKDNELLVYPHITLKWRCTKLVKFDYLTQIKLFDLCFKIHSGHHWSRSNLCQVLHIIVDKLNELLVYPHIIFMWRCTKLVKCDYLTQIKLFVLCFKIHSGHNWSISKFMPSSSHHCRQA